MNHAPLDRDSLNAPLFDFIQEHRIVNFALFAGILGGEIVEYRHENHGDHQPQDQILSQIAHTTFTSHYVQFGKNSRT